MRNGTLLRDKQGAHYWTMGVSFPQLSNTKNRLRSLPPSSSYSPNDHPLYTISRGDEPTFDEMTEVIRSMPNLKAAGPDSLLAELLKLDHTPNSFALVVLTPSLSMFGEREWCPPAMERCDHQSRSFTKTVAFIATISTTGDFHLLLIMPARRYCWRPSHLAFSNYYCEQRGHIADRIHQPWACIDSTCRQPQYLIAL